MYRARHTSLFILTLFLTRAPLPCPAALAEDRQPDAATIRKYHDGPLTATDFQAQPPQPVPILPNGNPQVASTYVELRYTFQYRAQESKGRWTATATEATVFSKLDRERSWNRRPNDPRVLDHEQGHFDIGELFAQRGRAAMALLIKDGKLSGQGKSEADAKAQVERQVQREFENVFQQHNAAQKEYDQTTNHGLEAIAQAAARKEQREKLEAGK